jgi:hypothetical protein
MMIIPIGKLRGLQQCTFLRGTIPCLVINHQQNLRKGLPGQPVSGFNFVAAPLRTIET